MEYGWTCITNLLKHKAELYSVFYKSLKTISKQICIIVQNNFIRNKHLNGLKINLKTYGYPEKIVEIGILKTFKIQQTIP